MPSHLLFLERMPLSPNGKLDRRALPKPDAGLMQRHHMAPASALEKDVAAIWGELLGVERVGLTDNFFEWADTRCWRRAWSRGFARISVSKSA